MALTEMVVMPGADYQAICDSVRAKTGGTALLKSGDIPAIIDAITGGGGGGALPTGIAKMNCGFITNTTPYVDFFEIEHGLGVKPDFAIITVTGDITEDFPTDAVYFGATTQYFNSNGKGLGFYNQYNKDINFVTNMWGNTYTDETYFRIHSLGFPLAPGVTYFWLAAVLDV